MQKKKSFKLVLIYALMIGKTNNFYSQEQTIFDSLKIINIKEIDSMRINRLNKPFSIENDSLKKDNGSLSSKLFPKRETDLNKDSIISKEKIKNGTSNFIRTQLKSIKPNGTISVGYEYGILPYVTSDNYPNGGFSSQGNISMMLLNIPLLATFRYSTIKNAIGLNNYFKVSFDTDRFKEQLSNQLNSKTEIQRYDLNKLQLQQQKTLQKIELLSYLQNHPDYKIVSDTSKPNCNKYSDSNSISEYTMPTNSIGIDTSINSNYSVNYKKDSITNELTKYKSNYDSINKKINTIKQQIELLNTIKDNPSSSYNPYLSKVQQFLSGIKKFEIGLCNPSYSYFLVNNVPLQGINLEYARNNKFIAITYGTTINNLLFNTNTIQGTMETSRNLYNYFDFTNLDAGRKILCIKGGLGTKEENHLYIGMLAGQGRTDYLQPISDGLNNSSSKETNIAMEIDAKYKVSSKTNIELIYGKSSIQTGNLSSNQFNNAINEIFSDYRSNAMLIKLNTDLSKTKTKLTFSTRWIDPFFRSFGVGFLRSNNLRYEIKADQYITKRIRYTIAYKREEDNLLKLYNYKNTLQSINNILSIKLSRQINIRLIYVPLFRELKTENNIIKDRNNITTTIISYIPKSKKIISQFNLLYSRYLITGDSTNINFENFTYTHNIGGHTGFKTGTNISWFKNSLSDTIGNDTYLAVVDAGYSTSKGHSIIAGGKIAARQKIAPQYGFLIKLRLMLYKKLTWEAEAEKILIGDYYNSFTHWNIKSFPYYLSSRLILNF